MTLSLYALVEHAVVGCVLGYFLLKAVAGLVGLEETRCRDALFQDIDDGLTREGRGLEPKEKSVERAWIL